MIENKRERTLYSPVLKVEVRWSLFYALMVYFKCLLSQGTPSKVSDVQIKMWKMTQLKDEENNYTSTCDGNIAFKNCLSSRGRL